MNKPCKHHLALMNPIEGGENVEDEELLEMSCLICKHEWIMSVKDAIELYPACPGSLLAHRDLRNAGGVDMVARLQIRW